ncbi:class III extradiol ring-cleavage dioxygenase [Aestuariivirga sp.]|uniref:DODA-type extradiol aromatic ring-opening family dioxygenase n=1 Tax=Aestuariivirga sp. TaxID=2650926 RepID=UPI0035941F7F
MSNRMPTFFISHGGGPWPWLPQMRAMLKPLEDSLAAIPGQLPEPAKAILMVSGHWEEPDFAVMSSANPPMVYDYSNFPAFTYEIKYEAPGAPALAARTRDLIANAGLSTHLDPARGYDHGVFAPMAVMYPDASVPTYQVSLKSGYDPELHLQLGRALAPLRDEGVVIVGSGLSYHNLRRMGEPGRIPSAQFDAWLDAAVTSEPEKRVELLKAWDTAPAARICHPEEDHLIPLMTAVGAAESEKATRIYYDNNAYGGITASSYRFG